MIDRRLFLSLVLPGMRVLSTAAPLGAAEPSDDLRTLESRLVRLLPEMSAREVGREYLDRRPSWSRSAPDALARLLEAVTRTGPAGASDDRAWRQALAEAVRGDFREGRTVRVANWTLSETEAELCALMARRTGSP